MKHGANPPRVAPSEAPKGAKAPARGWTPKFIESLAPRSSAFEIADPVTSGLVLRVSPTGVKSFRWYVRGPGWRRAVTIGPWSFSEAPGFRTLAQARHAREQLGRAHKGGTLEGEIARLAAELAPRPAAPIDVETVDSVAARFLAMLDGRRKRPEVARDIYRRDIAPAIGHLALTDLRKSHCRDLVARVVEHAPVHAGKVLGLLKQLLAYAENVEDDFASPIANLKAANLGVEHNVRDRWLTEVEIPIFWRALDREGTPEQKAERSRMAAALRILLLTAARSGELRLAHWVDVEGARWTIPVANQKLTIAQAKTAKPFVIPLTPAAVALFAELRALAGKSPWVLANGDACYTDKALSKAMRRLWVAVPELAALPSATPHDLRRTARTWLGKLGVAPHIGERCLNHSIGKIVETYDQHDYLEERRAALTLWAAKVAQLVDSRPGASKSTARKASARHQP